MRNIILFILRVFAAIDEWSDISYEINQSYQDIIKEDEVYEFVEAKLINEFWVELDCKSSDIVDIKYFMYEDGEFMYCASNEEKNAFCTAGLDGIYKFLMEKSNFHQFCVENGIDRKVYRKPCNDDFMNYGLPAKIHAAVKKILNSNMNRLKIAALLRHLNVFTVFEPQDTDEFECQAQFFLKKSNGVCLVTNILKVKCIDGIFWMEGFGEINACDFENIKLWETVGEKERETESLNN